MARTARGGHRGGMSTITSTSSPLVLGPGEGERIVVDRNELLLKAAAPRVTAADYRAPAGFSGPPLHVHTAFDEVFYVLDGTLTIRTGDAVHEVGPGCSVYVDGSTPHTFANTTDEEVRMLVVCAPGGFEDYFRALADGDGEAIAAASERAGYRAA
jgi:mannose-6-phosphate isomerase-like protein (cupin superfamily)